MRPLNRRGFTIVELLLVAVMSVMLAALVSSVVMASGRNARRQAHALNQVRALAAVSAWWRADLRDREAGDVVVAAADRLIARHPVGAGIPCQVNGMEIFIRHDGWRGTRDPEAGRDELWLLIDPVAGDWVTAVMVAVGSATCPDGTAALRLTLGVAAPAALLVRAVEPLILQHYRSGSSWWFGLAPLDGSAVVQPFAGPFDPVATRFAMDSSGVHVFVQPAGGRLHEYLGPLSPP